MNDPATADGGATASPCFTVLHDGRQLCYDQTGRLDGIPILYFHGTGSCRLGRHPDDGIADRLGVRLVSIDRPGCGRSSSHPGRRVVDWSADVGHLADVLELRQFGILAWSGGAPYAAACAHALPHRVAAMAIVSGVMPLSGPGGSKGMDRSARLFLQLADISSYAVVGPLALLHATAALDPNLLISLLFAESPACDQAILNQPAIRRMLIAAYREAARGGVRGMAHEASLMSKPWGLRPEDISPSVAVYHGDEDTIAPLSMGRWLAETLPEATLRVFCGEGHQLIWPRWEEVLAELAGSTRDGMARS